MHVPTLPPDYSHESLDSPGMILPLKTDVENQPAGGVEFAKSKNVTNEKTSDPVLDLMLAGPFGPSIGLG